jgi:hypothetical protein
MNFGWPSLCGGWPGAKALRRIWVLKPYGLEGAGFHISAFFTAHAAEIQPIAEDLR